MERRADSFAAIHQQGKIRNSADARRSGEMFGWRPPRRQLPGGIAPRGFRKWENTGLQISGCPPETQGDRPPSSQSGAVLFLRHDLTPEKWT